MFVLFTWIEVGQWGSIIEDVHQGIQLKTYIKEFNLRRTLRNSIKDVYWGIQLKTYLKESN